MITLELIADARKVGGKESWRVLKQGMKSGQKFYCTSLGEMEFIGFVAGVTIFKTRNGYSSYDYFYRELMCADVLFLSKQDMIDANIHSSLNNLYHMVKNKDDFWKQVDSLRDRVCHK